MGFIGDIVSAVVDVILTIVEIVVQVIEFVIQFIMMLLGYDETSQTIEYFEVHNIPLFDDPDGSNPLLETIQEAIITGSDVALELIYASAFRSYKGDIQKFMNFVEDGDYNERFPAIESYITYPDYTELTAALADLRGVACTLEQAYTRAPTTKEWVEYWLQENQPYSYENKTITNVVVINLSTSPGSVSSSATTGGSSPNWTVTITDGIAASDSTTGTISELSVDLGSIAYNSGTDTYSIYADDDGGTAHLLPYSATSKPTGLHYVASYYIDSAPAVAYLFLYKVGTGTYADLDNPQNAINLDATILHAVPSIPLRLNNVDYTSFPAITTFHENTVSNAITLTIHDDIQLADSTVVNSATVGTSTSKNSRVKRIEDLCDLISIDAEQLLDKINNDPSAPSAGDLDHIYLTFGVRLWDTSQTGMSYLFTLCENLFPVQGSTKGNYDNTASGDTKPTNNILISSDHYNYGFQFNYLSYEFTALAAINADSGSAANGYYYSDMSRFDSSGILGNPYYISSGKGTYNVGFKASTLTEVASFLAGSGTTNPGTTTTEAANWLQVTKRLNYNNSTPVLQDADGSTSSLVYLTPDLVYENNGSGVLRHVQVASEETTSGQSITYYRAVAAGLEAYTMAAPIASLRVVDGATSKFKIVKFNLGHPDDLMAPFIHNFIANLSNKTVTQLFLSGAHASLYIAHYEVIVQRTSKFGGIFLVVILVILVVVAWYVGPALFPSLFSGVAGAGTTTGLLSALGLLPVSAAGASLTGALIGQAVMTFLVKFAVSQLIKMAITKAFGDSPLASFLGSVAGMYAAGGFSVDASGNIVPDFASIRDFSIDKFIADWSWSDTFKLMIGLANTAGGVLEYRAQEGYKSLEEEMEQTKKDQAKRLLELNDAEAAQARLFEGLFDQMENGVRIASLLVNVNVRTIPNPMLAEHVFTLNDEIHASIASVDTDYDGFFNGKSTSIGGYA